MKARNCDKAESKLSKDVGQNSKTLRTRARISQEELANEIGISVSHYRDIEHGHGNPTVKTLEKISQTLHATPLELLSAKSDPKIICRNEMPDALAECLKGLSGEDQELFCCLLDQIVSLISDGSNASHQ